MRGSSFKCSPPRRVLGKLKGEGGYMLPLTLVALAFATLVVIPLLVYASTRFLSEARLQDAARARLAAEAGLNRVVSDLIRGADGVPTVYTTTNPPGAGQTVVFTFTTSYAVPTVNINGYSPVITIARAPTAWGPAMVQQYFDPGVRCPYLASVSPGYGYLIRLYNVHSGTIQVNWAYTPEGTSRVGVWAGLPVDPHTKMPYPPGQIDGWPTDTPILDTGLSPAKATYNRTDPRSIGPGFYTIVFYKFGGTTPIYTRPFQPSGGTEDTWIYAVAATDYLISSRVGDVNLSAYVRQIPGYMEPPSGDWGPNNPAWITNTLYARSWSTP